MPRAASVTARWRRCSSGNRSWVPRTGCKAGMEMPYGCRSGRGRVGGRALGSFDFRRLLLHPLDPMIDDALILVPVLRPAGEVDWVRVVAAAGEADIGLARLART